MRTPSRRRSGRLTARCSGARTYCRATTVRPRGLWPTTPGRVFVGTSESVTGTRSTPPPALSTRAPRRSAPAVAAIPIAAGGRLYLGAAGRPGRGDRSAACGAYVGRLCTGARPPSPATRSPSTAGNLMPGILDAATGAVLWSKPYTTVSSGHTAAIAGGKVVRPAGGLPHRHRVRPGDRDGRRGPSPRTQPAGGRPCPRRHGHRQPPRPALVYACAPAPFTGGRCRPVRSSVAVPYPRRRCRSLQLIVDGVVYLSDRSVIYAPRRATPVCCISSIDVHVQTFTGERTRPEAAPVDRGGRRPAGRAGRQRASRPTQQQPGGDPAGAGP